jgi:hypothetical protein
MLSQLLDVAQTILDKTLGVRFVTSKALQDLVRRNLDTEDKVSALTSELGSLRQEHRSLHKQHEQVALSEQLQRARIDWLNAAFQKSLWQQNQQINEFMASALHAELSRQQAKDGYPRAKKTAAIVLTSVSQITQLAALANSIKVREEYDLVVVGFADVARPDITQLCDHAKITLLSHDLKVIVGTRFFLNEMDEPAADYERALATVQYSDPERERMREIAGLVSEMSHHTRLSANARKLLRESRASLVVLFEDNAEYVTGIWISVGRELSVPSVILPYTIADQLEPAEAHYNNEAYWADNGICNRLAGVLAPHWLFFYRDRWLLRRAGLSVLAAESLGTAPPLPWVLNSTKANSIAVESEAMRQHYLAQGIAETQLVMTGSVTDDLLHQACHNRAMLRKELGLDSRPILLCSLPPNQLTATRHECEFFDFGGVVDFWLGELRKLQWQVLIKPHPSVRDEDLKYIRKHDLRIVTEHDTTSLIPLCDLYNPSVSSTIRWALACGKPVLNYDVYRYRYQEFVAELAVRTVFDAAEFAAELKRLTEDPEVLRQYCDHARAAAPRWGMIDGHSLERVVALFGQLTERRA